MRSFHGTTGKGGAAGGERRVRRHSVLVRGSPGVAPSAARRGAAGDGRESVGPRAPVRDRTVRAPVARGRGRYSSSPAEEPAGTPRPAPSSSGRWTSETLTLTSTTSSPVVCSTAWITLRRMPLPTSTTEAP